MTDDILYTAEALATGAGRSGHVTTTDGSLDLAMAIPAAMGGPGGGANPELLFAAGYATCFHSALQMVARQRKIRIDDSSVGSQVHIIPEGVGFRLAVHLEVVIPELDHDIAQSLADAAHDVCPYSNATRGNIDVTIGVSDD